MGTLPLKWQNFPLAFCVLVFGLALIPSDTQATPVDCSTLLTSVADRDIAQALASFIQVDRPVLSGAVTPKWTDFDVVQKATSLMKSRYGTMAPAEIDALKAELDQIEKVFIDDYHFSSDLTREGVLGADYKPAEYELKSAFRRDLEDLNKVLPPRIKLIMSELPANQRSSAQLLERSRDLIKKYVTWTEANLLERNVGPTTMEQFLEKIHTWVDALPETQPLYPAIKKVYANPELYDYAIRRPVGGRFWTPKTGFHNQRITGTSRGSLGTSMRDKAEANLLNLVGEDYAAFDNDLKPKYGYLSFRSESGLRDLSQGTTEHYGEDIYLLKKDTMKDRTTFTVGDSLTAGLTSTVSHFEKKFIPIKDLDYSIPFWNEARSPDQSAQMMQLKMSRSEIPGLESFDKSVGSSAYLELQFFGPLSLDDVERFVFTTQAPQGEFLHELQSRNIKILDGTLDHYKPVAWTPPTEVAEVAPATHVEPSIVDAVIARVESAVGLDTHATAATTETHEVILAKIKSLIPQAPEAGIKFGPAVGRIDVVKDVDFSYLAQFETVGTKRTLLIPMATSRLEGGWIDSPEWWKAHETEIRDAKAQGKPLPHQDRHEVSAWLSASGLSTNPDVIIVENAVTKRVPLQDFLVQHIKDHSSGDGFIDLYRGAERGDEAASWRGHMRPRGARYWTPSATYAWRYGRKNQGFLRSLIKGDAPVLKFRVPVGDLKRLVKNHNWVLGTELPKPAHLAFDTSGEFMDHLTGSVYVGEGDITPEIELRARSAGADAFIPYYQGQVGIEDLAKDRVKKIELTITRVQKQTRPNTSALVEKLQSRITRTKAEMDILVGIRDHAAFDRINQLLSALPPGNAEIANVDGDSLEQLVQDYVNGRL